MTHDITAKYADVLAAAKKLADENPTRITNSRGHYWVNGEPQDLVAATLEAVGFKPTEEWLKLHNHQHVMFWGDQAFSDWATKVFFPRLQHAIDRGKSWKAAVIFAESQTKAYYRNPINSAMIEIMYRESHYPGSTPTEEVLK